MQITRKGPVTIPLQTRNRLGLLPHTEVEFELAGDSARIRKARRPMNGGVGGAKRDRCTPRYGRRSHVHRRDHGANPRRPSSRKERKMTAALALLTRDVARYRTCFPTIELLGPS